MCSNIAYDMCRHIFELSGNAYEAKHTQHNSFVYSISNSHNH